eukprot:3548920-Karenia_brevis.AAC.1
MASVGHLKPRTESAELFRHVFRELNVDADKLAGQDHEDAMIQAHSWPAPYLRLQFDGSSTASKSACGWVLYGSHSVKDDSEQEWTKLAWHSFRLPARVSSTAAELEALVAAVSFLHAYAQGVETAWSMLQNWQPVDFSKASDLRLAEELCQVRTASETEVPSE